MEYDDIAIKFNKNDMVKSLNNGKIKKYSGHLTVLGRGDSRIGIDSFNEDLVVYKNGELAEVIEKGIDHEAIAINNAINTCRRLGCTPSELLHKDYIKEIEITKQQSNK